MNVKVLSSFSFAKLKRKEKTVFIVIDTFRATSSIVTMKNSGASSIYVTDNGDNAKKLKTFLPGALLVGESKGIMIDGFDYGNTPFIFSKTSFKEQEIIFTSSNGAKTIMRLKGYDNIFLGSLLNLNAVTTKVAEIAIKEEYDIYILPSGSALDEMMYVVEDWLTGVLIADNLSTNFGFTDISEGDFYLKTLELVKSEYNYSHLLKNSTNGKSLFKLGFGDDVNFAIQLSKMNCVPKIKEFREVDEISFSVIE